MNVNEDVRKLYNECKRLDKEYKGFNSGKTIEEIETDEERRFAVHISNFFLAERQKDIVKKGVF